MANTTFIKIETICTHYQVETFFIDSLHDAGLIEIHLHQKCKCIPDAQLTHLEKIIRLHQELELNPEGIDVVLNLLGRIESQQEKIRRLENQLGALTS